MDYLYIGLAIGLGRTLLHCGLGIGSRGPHFPGHMDISMLVIILLNWPLYLLFWLIIVGCYITDSLEGMLDE